ncbi:hypothetical protein FACS1894187_20760 [Synergistales bacterium]|nr:hypothetical protein FACS1894187_20760 [Synergistales bacterium]
MMKRINIPKTMLLVLLLFVFVSTSSKVSVAASGDNEHSTADNIVSLELECFDQIRDALIADFWTQYGIYLRVLATGHSVATANAIYPKWLIAGDGHDGKANFQYLMNKYLPNFPTGDFYEIEYVAPGCCGSEFVSGHVIIHKKYADISTQERFRVLAQKIPSVSIENLGVNGVISIKVSPPSTFHKISNLQINKEKDNSVIEKSLEEDCCSEENNDISEKITNESVDSCCE